MWTWFVAASAHATSVSPTLIMEKWAFKLYSALSAALASTRCHLLVRAGSLLRTSQTSEAGVFELDTSVFRWKFGLWRLFFPVMLWIQWFWKNFWSVISSFSWPLISDESFAWCYMRPIAGGGSVGAPSIQEMVQGMFRETKWSDRIRTF